METMGEMYNCLMAGMDTLLRPLYLYTNILRGRPWHARQGWDNSNRTLISDVFDFSNMHQREREIQINTFTGCDAKTCLRKKYKILFTARQKRDNESPKYNPPTTTLFR